MNKYLKLGLVQDVNKEEFEFVEETEKCPTCNFKCNNKYETYLYDSKKIIMTCFFCHVVINFEKKYINCVVPVETNMSQKDIIYKTNEYYDENDTIIMPLELDEDMKKIKINIYKCLLDNKFNEYSVIITNRIINHLGNKINMFNIVKKKQNNYDISYWNLPEN
jgi:hypothetical protein